MAKLHVFNVGYCTHPACMALRGAGLASRQFPAHAYLIETSAGLCLWDTGYGPKFKTCATGVYAPYRWTTPVHYEHEVDNLALQLSARGINARDIGWVFISHFHADHMAALNEYPRARLIAASAAIDSINGKTGLSALRQGFIPELLPENFSARIEAFEKISTPIKLPVSLAPFAYGWKVDSSGEFLVVPLPGHARGHLGAFIQTGKGWELLASDAAWDHRGYQQLRGPSELAFLIQDNRKSYYSTLARLHELHQKGGVTIHLSHD